MNKKIFIISLFLFGFCSSLLAQMNLWGKVGITNSFFKYHNDNYNYRDRYGGAIGLGSVISIYKSFSLQPELCLVQKGGFISEKIPYLDFKEDLKLTYIELPVTVNYYLSLLSNNKLRYNLNLGLYAGFKIWEKTESHIIDLETSTLGPGSKPYFDNGLVLGTGIELFTIFHIDFRYTIGLRNALDHSNNKVYNNVYCISLYFKIK